MQSLNSKIKYVPIISVSDEMKARVRSLRNRPSVREFMYTDHEISPSEHSEWMSSLVNDARRQVYIVLFNGDLLGVVALSNIDHLHKTADWGFYIDDTLSGIGVGIGSLIEFDLLEYTFNETQIEKLNCEVLETNLSVIKLHRKFGFHDEGVFRKNIIKNNSRVDVFRFGILKQEWKESKAKIEGLLIRTVNR